MQNSPTRMTYFICIRALASVINPLVFKHVKCSLISICDKSFANWVNKPRYTTFYFDEFSFTEAVNFLTDNLYFTLGSLVLYQIIGVPIGVDPGPYMLLTLLYGIVKMGILKSYIDVFT